MRMRRGKCGRSSTSLMLMCSGWHPRRKTTKSHCIRCLGCLEPDYCIFPDGRLAGLHGLLLPANLAGIAECPEFPHHCLQRNPFWTGFVDALGDVSFERVELGWTAIAHVCAASRANPTNGQPWYLRCPAGGLSWRSERPKP